jgi:hypothetical protein
MMIMSWYCYWYWDGLGKSAREMSIRSSYLLSYYDMCVDTAERMRKERWQEERVILWYIPFAYVDFVWSIDRHDHRR